MGSDPWTEDESLLQDSLRELMQADGFGTGEKEVRVTW